jgi:hypothetical protein
MLSANLLVLARAPSATYAFRSMALGCSFPSLKNHGDEYASTHF